MERIKPFTILQKLRSAVAFFFLFFPNGNFNRRTDVVLSYNGLQLVVSAGL